MNWNERYSMDKGQFEEAWHGSPPDSTKLPLPKAPELGQQILKNCSSPYCASVDKGFKLTPQDRVTRVNFDPEGRIGIKPAHVHTGCLPGYMNFIGEHSGTIGPQVTMQHGTGVAGATSAPHEPYSPEAVHRAVFGDGQ